MGEPWLRRRIEMICHILPRVVGDGPTQMGLDHALLDAVDSDPSAAFLRFYSWSEPTLSLGYFQTYGTVEADPRWHNVPVVRRPSGGGALWHDREVTYALIVPRSHPLAVRPTLLYRAIHAAMAARLCAQGFAATRRGPVASNSNQPAPFLCFQDRDSEDVLLRGSKIIGSAQRRRPRAVLQHGSLLFEASPRAPELLGVKDLEGHAPSVDEVETWLNADLCRTLEMPGGPTSWNDSILAKSRSLAEQVYLSPEWTKKR